MDISKIYSKSWQITKKYKILWFFGAILTILAGGGISYSNFSSFGDLGSDLSSITNHSSNQIATSSALTTTSNSVTNPWTVERMMAVLPGLFSQVPPLVWLMLVVAILILILIGVGVGYAGRAWILGAFIGGIDEAIDDKQLSINEISKHGFKSFKSQFWLLIVPGLIYFLYLLILISLALIVALMVGFSASDTVKIILAFVGVLILLPLVIFPSTLLAATQIWSVRIATIEGVPGWQALKTGWKLVKGNWGYMFLLGLVNGFLSGGVGCLTMIILIPVSLMLLAIGAISFAVSPALGILVVVLFLLLLICLGSGAVFLYGAYSLFNYSTWTVWYRELTNQQRKELLA